MDGYGVAGATSSTSILELLKNKRHENQVVFVPFDH